MDKRDRKRRKCYVPAFICPDISTWCPLFSSLEPRDVKFIYHTSKCVCFHLPHALEKKEPNMKKEQQSKIKDLFYQNTHLCRLICISFGFSQATCVRRLIDSAVQIRSIRGEEKRTACWVMCLKAVFTGTFSFASRASGVCMCKSIGPWPDPLWAIMKHIVELHYHQRAPCVDCD